MLPSPRSSFSPAAFILALLLSVAPRISAQEISPPQDYLFFVVSEAADQLSLVRFGPSGLHIEKQVHVGIMPVDVNGPHGIAVSPDKKYVYVSVGHGMPNGSLWKFDASTMLPLAHVDLGLFPATVDISPDGDFLYVANANFHGDMVPSSVSVVATEEMIEVKRITTCTMPHGSRLNAQGTRHYSACMMDDMLVEIDTSNFKVARYFSLTQGHEHGANGAPTTNHTAVHGVMPHRDLGCTPTWAQPSNDGKVIYVACNQTNDIAAIDTASWTMVRRFPAGQGVYNLAMTKDGRLIATNKRGQSVSIFGPANGKELARLPTRRTVVHGIVVTPDDRYAFVSVEGVGAAPGTVEVIDLGALKTVATLDLPSQAAGLDFWRMAPPNVTQTPSAPSKH